MMQSLLVTINGEDQVGLIAAIANVLFELGANLADTSFSVLGNGFEFSSIVEMPDSGDAGSDRILMELRALPQLEGAQVSVSDFQLEAESGDRGAVTHRIHVRGGDRPGLVARLSEVFIGFDANILRMNCRRRETSGGVDYRTTFAVSIPEERQAACLSAISNTAGSLGLVAEWSDVDE